MSDETNIQDRKEIDRTCQANERTLLAYLRTGLGLVVASIAMVYFSHGDWFGVVGIVCIPIGVITGIVGLVRYRRMSKHIFLLQERHKVDLTDKEN
jgi:putative membrane protein